ncbi:MAG: HTH-type transcriptional regulator LrpA [Candidatus Thorarchaeota archaeon AB_25]|nr:MAG: HTH-type transcriptional regulator LrpA [Candidatus Thorarchaeota archaeon AB_25]
MSPIDVSGRMYKMDPIDRLIIERLKINCRTSLQNLSKISGFSANAVRKRIDSLEASGVIHSYTVWLSPLMTNEDSVIAILEFETDQLEKKLIKNLSSNPSVSKVSRLLDGRYIVFGVCFDSEELSSLTMHLRTLPGISNVEMYSRFLHYWGGKIDFTSSHRDILRCLIRDPRMPISDVAKETGLPSNEIKEIITQMRESEAVLFTINTSDVTNEESMEVLVKVQWNVGKTSNEHVLGWFQEKFASSYLGEYVSATEPTLFFNFLVNHVQEVEIVVQKTKESGLVSTIEPLILFPGTSFPDPRLRRANQLLEETGFSSQNGPFA